MYRALLLFCLLGLVAAQCDQRGRRYTRSTGWPFQSGSGSSNGRSGGSSHRWPFGGGRQNSIETATAEIARNLMDAGRKMHQFCMAHSNRALREVYGVEHYQLRVVLNEFSEDDIQVIVRNRLVVVNAQKCPTEYAAVRILPDIVNPQRSEWKLERGVLTVLFPYNMASESEIQTRCGMEIDEDVIIVPKSSVGTTFAPDYDLAFGDANFKKAILGYLADLAKNKNNGGTPVTQDDGSTEYIDSNFQSNNHKNSNSDDIEMVVQRTS